MKPNSSERWNCQIASQPPRSSWSVCGECAVTRFDGQWAKFVIKAKFYHAIMGLRARAIKLRRFEGSVWFSTCLWLFLQTWEKLQLLGENERKEDARQLCQSWQCSQGAKGWELQGWVVDWALNGPTNGGVVGTPLLIKLLSLASSSRHLDSNRKWGCVCKERTPGALKPGKLNLAWAAKPLNAAAQSWDYVLRQLNCEGLRVVCD